MGLGNKVTRSGLDELRKTVPSNVKATYDFEAGISEEDKRLYREFYEGGINPALTFLLDVGISPGDIGDVQRILYHRTERVSKRSLEGNTRYQGFKAARLEWDLETVAKTAAGFVQKQVDDLKTRGASVAYVKNFFEGYSTIGREQDLNSEEFALVMIVIRTQMSQENWDYFMDFLGKRKKKPIF